MFKKLKIKCGSHGAALIEYVLIVSLLSVALVGGYKTVGQGYTRIYSNLNKAIP